MIFKHLFKRLSLLMILLSIANSSFGQLINPKSDKAVADSLIQELKTGTLIVPLMKNSAKIKMLEKWLQNESLDNRTTKRISQDLSNEKKSIQEFNESIVKYFTRHFDFCNVLFVYTDQLSGFDPTQAIFIDPVRMESDPSLEIGQKSYFFLRYFKASGIATQPDEVRAFFISDNNFELLERPFPNSPDRQTSLKLRFRDLLNLSLNTNDTIQILVIKLNDNLNRYFKR